MAFENWRAHSVSERVISIHARMYTCIVKTQPLENSINFINNFAFLLNDSQIGKNGASHRGNWTRRYTKN